MNYRIGMDIGATKTKVLLITRAGKILAKEKFPTESFGRVEPIIERTASVMEKMLKANGINLRQIEWIGCGTAGQLDPATGYIDNSPNLKWFGVQFGKKFEKRLGRKIRLVNDVNAAGWGEFIYGAGRDYGKGCQNLVCVYVGSGIGGGIVCNGKLVEGATGTAGEIGHLIFREDGIMCDCGHRGCHEAYAGGVPMENRMRKMVRAGKGRMVREMVKGDLSRINTRTIADAARKGDPAAKLVWNDAVASLQVLCANLVSVFNPEVLVLGGGVIEGNPTLVPTIRAYVKSHAVDYSARTVRLVKSRLANDAIALGAAAIIETGGCC
jgi:glucokinase